MTKPSWYVTSLVNTYLPVVVFKLKNLFDLSIAPDIMTSPCGWVPTALTLDWKTESVC